MRKSYCSLDRIAIEYNLNPYWATVSLQLGDCYDDIIPCPAVENEYPNDYPNLVFSLLVVVFLFTIKNTFRSNEDKTRSSS